MQAKKRIAVILGSPFNVIRTKNTLKNLIEKKLNSKFKKVSQYVYKIESEKSVFTFYSCYKPKRDESYEASRKHFTSLGEDVPPPASKVAKRIKNVDIILILGTCGSIDGKKNHIYTPNKFYDIEFEKTFIRHKEIEDLEILDKPIKCKNLLSGKLKIPSSRVITSNVTFIPDRIENGSMKHLKILAKISRDFADCVDMESYVFVKKFNNKIPLGIMLFSSDVIGKHTKMRFQLKKFQETVVETVKLFS